jgi:hypothetical protein
MMIVLSMVVLALLALRAHAGFVCGIFDDIAIGDQPIIDDGDCGDVTVAGVCDNDTIACTTEAFYVNGSSSTDTLLTTVICSDDTCPDALTCGCVLTMCSRTLPDNDDDDDNNVAVAFQCYDDDSVPSPAVDDDDDVDDTDDDCTDDDDSSLCNEPKDSSLLWFFILLGSQFCLLASCFYCIKRSYIRRALSKL